MDSKDSTPAVGTRGPAPADEAFALIRESHRRRLGERSVAPGEVEATVAAGFPWRGLSLGLVGVAVLSIVTPYSDAYLQASALSATYLPTGVFFLFFFMLGVNAFLRLTRFALTPQELMLAYTTMLVPSAIPSDGFVLRMLPLLVELQYYATPMNEWNVFHASHVPPWMVPHGDNVVTWFFAGRPAGAAIPWHPWVRPLAIWSLLAVGLYMVLASLSLAFRKRWMDAERLQFPLAQVPLMIMGDDPAPSLTSAFFRNPLLWAAAAVPLFFHGINGLHLYFPVIPAIKLADLLLGQIFSGSRLLTDPPFNRWADVNINFYWSVIGISYLLRSEVSLSVWVFEWFCRIEQIAFHISGVGDGLYNWSPLHTFGYTLMARYQRVGAFAVTSAIFLWASRNEIREMVRAAFGMRRSAQDRQTIPWWSFWAFLGGLGIYFGWTGATGMNTVASVALLVFFLLIAVTTARIVAATGLLWVYDFFLPMHGLDKVVGTARIDPRSFTMVGYVDFAVLSNRANLMPQTLDSMKIIRQTGIRQGHFFLGMALGIIVAIAVSSATILWLAYTRGAVNLASWHFHGGGDWLFNRVAGFQRYHVFTDWTVIGCMAAGGSFMALLLYLHRTYLWWPLYPLGFVIGGTVAVGQIWFPVFLGWLAKTLVLRLSGAPTYHRLKAVALGLLIGEFIAVGIWLAIDMATGTTMHRVFPAWAPQ